MYTNKLYESDLVNSYAWDTAILFIQTCGKETDSNIYSRQCKSENFQKTGANQKDNYPDKYRNIYDMSGNACEWTTETCSVDGRPCSSQGGYNTGSAYTNYRNCLAMTISHKVYGFRPLIYIAL